MVKSGNNWLIFLIIVVLAVQVLSAHEVVAYPDLDVEISQKNITVSAGNPATVQVTYENIGDTDLNLTLYVYDDGSIESSPRPILIYEGQRFTTVIDTEVIFGSMYLSEGQIKQIDVTFEVSPNMASGNYSMHIAGYHEKIGNTYYGSDTVSFVLVVPSKSLAKPTLINPSNNSELKSVPTLQWSQVSGAQGYNWEIATSPDIGSSGYYFVDSVCSGSTTSTSATIRCDLQMNVWYYWHVWAYASGQPSPLSDTWKFIITDGNRNPRILYAGVFPGSGDTDDTYVFKATYSDEDNDPPSVIRVYVDGSPHNMSAVNPSDTNYTDGNEYKYETSLSTGTHNYYVYCEDGRGGSDRSPDSGTLTGPIVSCTPPSAPTLSYPSYAATNIDLKPTFSWSSVSGATQYTIQVSTTSSFSSYTINQTVSSTSYTPPTNFSENTTYYWRVRAGSSCGSSSWSSVWSFTTSCTPPSAPTLSYPSYAATNIDLKPTFSWSSVSGATQYTIQVSTTSSFSSYTINQTVSSTSYTPSSSFSENTTYYWRVKAESNCGSSSWSSVWSFKTICTPPSAPTLSYPSYGAANVDLKPTFSWSSVSGATQYTIQISTTSSFSSYTINQTVSSTSYTVPSTLTENTTYYWRVRAESNCGSSSWSSVWSFKTICTPPSAPTLTSPVNGATDVSLRPTFSWNSVSGVTQYTIQISTTSSFSSYIINQLASSTSYTPFDLAEDTTYYWRVRAESNCGSSNWSSVWSFTTESMCTPPSAPTLISPVNGTTDVSLQPTFSWSSVSGATQYTIQISTTSSFSFYTINQLASSTSYTVPSNLTENTTYYWRVRAESNCGSSSWSSVWSFTTSCTPPSALTLTSPVNGTTDVSLQPTFSWSSVSGATQYTIQVSTTSSFSSYTINQTVSSTSYTPSSNLAENTTYYWRVRAESNCGSSSWSSVWSFRTICTPPSALTLTSPVNGTTDVSLQPTFSWSSVSGATQYTIQVSTTSSFSSYTIDHAISATSHTPSFDLSENTTYYWRVKAENDCGSSSWSSVWSFTTSCTPPSALTLTSPVNGAIDVSLQPTFSWSSVSGATQYTIQVSTTSSFSSYTINQTVSSTSYTPSSNLAENTTYYWRVRAENDCGSSSWSSVWSFTAVCGSVPPAPRLETPLNGEKKVPVRPTLRWIGPSNIRYVIQIATSGDFSAPIIDEIVYDILFELESDLSTSTTYYWRVRAENDCGYSDWSDVWKFETAEDPCPALSPPVIATPDGEEGEGEIELQWIAVPYADLYNGYYYVEISTKKEFSPETIVKTLETTSVSIKVKLPAGTYYWQVKAENDCVTGEWSRGNHYFIIHEPPWWKNPIFQVIGIIAAILAILSILASLFK